MRDRIRPLLLSLSKSEVKTLIAQVANDTYYHLSALIMITELLIEHNPKMLLQLTFLYSELIRRGKEAYYPQTNFD